VSQSRIIDHDHRVVRVIRAAWRDATDASYSQQRDDNRWNTRDFPALYCCCSLPVARAVVLDVFRLAGIVMEDLQPEVRPALAELAWSGRVVDVASAGGVVAAGLPPSYPDGVTKEETRRAAARWHEEGREGLVCRSASVWRRARGGVAWEGDHARWSELAVFPRRATRPVREERRRTDLRWLRAPREGQG
jgi:hypothetical protein